MSKSVSPKSDYFISTICVAGVGPTRSRMRDWNCTGQITEGDRFHFCGWRLEFMPKQHFAAWYYVERSAAIPPLHFFGLYKDPDFGVYKDPNIYISSLMYIYRDKKSDVGVIPLYFKFLGDFKRDCEFPYIHTNVFYFCKKTMLKIHFLDF